MALTNFGKLTDEELTIWSRDVWSAARNRSFMNKFVGESQDSMIQRITELRKDQKGARAVITLVQDLEGDGVAGDRTLEGNEEALSSDDVVINLDQIRNAARHEGKMQDQRSVVMFREHARDKLSYWLADRLDQLAFLTLSGVDYDMTTRGASRVGSSFPSLEFASDVNAPSTNRHRRWDASSGLVAGDTNAVANGDIPTWGMLVEMKAYAKDHYIKPIRGEGGMEFYHVFMTPQGMARLKLDTDFLAAYRNAMPRSKENPLFKGMDGIYVDGLLIHEYRHVYNTTGAVSGSGKWGSGSDIDGQRVLLCGSQAMGLADIGMPEWTEKGFDYDNQQGISLAKIVGMLKPRFYSIYDGAEEDFGVLAVDTALNPA
jgi:N4-gp56 family major capsid protein